MATAIAMDLDQCEATKGGKTAASLSINKSSASKISKASSLRRPIVQQAKPMPTSKVYNTDPMGFRTLVQELTGYAPSTTSAPASSTSSATSNNNNNLNSNTGMQPAFSQQPDPASVSASNQQQQMNMMIMNMNPQRPSSLSLAGAGGSSHMVMSEQTTSLPGNLSSPSATTTQVSSPQSSARPVNTRLQRMAPPPLRPTFSFNFAHKLQQQQIQIQQGQQQQESQQQIPIPQGQAPNLADNMNHDKENTNSMSSPGAHPLSPMSKRVSPMPLLSFSPLPVLSPTDNAWASFESPNTAAMKQLAQSIIEGKNNTNSSGGGMMMGVAGLSRFPWSPTFQACLGLPSPGLPVPELFPEVKMIDSPDTNNTCKDVSNDSANANINDNNSRNNNSIKNSTNSSSSNMFGNDFSFPEIRES